jgi:hypothetical protein
VEDLANTDKGLRPPLKTENFLSVEQLLASQEEI